ncbi:class I SAM-dependent methyltransferase [Stutzerimonas stutzeri]|uniref:class I SAM-dependent methyltransferase n=1 Tax=Stutzerimonas stutzeri TaxID=316 RepID=UPI001BCD1450|nr:methyltransferase domain-containing protein [Stutzerimonas stutzeri]
MSLDDIDFAERYRQHLRRSARPSKPPSAWDKRAAELAGKPLGGAYTEAFIRLMDLSGARSLLDIGCGPGTLCLPLAAQFERIYALDYSPGMLACLQARLDESGVDNVQPLQCAWEDDWSAVPVCDILIASRSGLVEDLDAALEKIHRHTRLRAYMTQLAGGHFIDPAIARLLGREQASVPDYIYTLNLLHQRGIHPRLDYIELPSRLAGCATFEEFAERVAWSLGPLDDVQRESLAGWYHADPERARQGGAPMRWAFIGWTVPSATTT